MKRPMFAALALLAACAPAATPPADPAPAPAAAGALNPVGVFQFTADGDEGETVTGTIEVTGQPGAYGGRIRAHDDEIPITSVSVDGQQMVVNAETPGGTMTLVVTFTGDTFLGGWSLRGDSGEIRGQRAP